MTEPGTAKRLGVAGLYVVVLTFGLFLLFFHLDSRLFWEDEAETAVLARNIIKFGVPKTTDGINHVTEYGGAIDGNRANIWVWSPWLQEYLTAGAFKLFGETTWAGRAPFAFVGWLCLVGFGWVAHRIYRDHWITLSGLLLFATSEMFLMHARQCRYYSLSVLGEILLIFAIHQLLSRRQSGAALLALALVLQFYSNYIIAVANLPVLAWLTWKLFHQKSPAAFWMVNGLVIFAAAALPWLIYAHPWKQLGVLKDPWSSWMKLDFYAHVFHFELLPWIFFALPLGALVMRRWLKRGEPRVIVSDFELQLVLLLVGYVAMLMIPPAGFARYLLPLLPVACLLAAVWMFRFCPWRGVALAVILIQCVCNGLAVATSLPGEGRSPFRLPLTEYVQSLARPYQSRLTDVLAFFEREAKPGQTVFVCDAEFPLKFYTKLRVIDARFPEEIKSFGGAPDWALPESASGVLNQPLTMPPEFRDKYEARTIPVHDSVREGVLPEPRHYEYRTATNLVPYVVYQKK